MICKVCQDIFTSYICDDCNSEIIILCRECHNEIKHGIIEYNTGNPVHGGNATPYTEDDAPYFPGVSDKFRNA
jgi:hypothetical protein